MTKFGRIRFLNYTDDNFQSWNFDIDYLVILAVLLVFKGGISYILHIYHRIRAASFPNIWYINGEMPYFPNSFLDIQTEAMVFFYIFIPLRIILRALVK